VNKQVHEKFSFGLNFAHITMDIIDMGQCTAVLSVTYTKISMLLNEFYKTTCF